MSKPICFSYKAYTDLREAYAQLLEDNQQLMADNRELRQKVQHQKDVVMQVKRENTNMKVLLFEAYLILKGEETSNDTTYN